MSTLAVELRLGEASQASAGPEKAETATFVRMTKQTWVRLQSTYLPIETECTRIVLKLYHNKEDHLKFQVFNSNPEQAKKKQQIVKPKGRAPKSYHFIQHHKCIIPVNRLSIARLCLSAESIFEAQMIYQAYIYHISSHSIMQ